MFDVNKETWFKELDSNNEGRDFIVGDLHGYYSLLMKGLESLNFDFKKDRLFSVGDLVDRGPETIECLNLLKEDWFYPVMGNHDFMLLSSLGKRSGLLDIIQSFLYTDRRKRNKLHLMEYVKLINELPIVMKINDSKVPFFIVHASRPIKKNIIWNDDIFEVHKNKTLKDKYIKKMMWSRKLPKEAMLENNIIHHKIINNSNISHLVTDFNDMKSSTPFEKDSSITYSGHTIMDKIVWHRSHIFIDGGRYKGGDLRIIEHSKTIEKIIDYKGKGGIIPSSCSI